MNLLQRFFPKKTKPQPPNIASVVLASFVETTRPRELADEVITAGDVNHLHVLVETSWNYQRFGCSVTDIDKDPTFPMAKFKSLYTCPCGHEV